MPTAHPVPIGEPAVPGDELAQLFLRAGLTVPDLMMADLQASFAALRRQLALLHAPCPPELPPLYLGSPLRPVRRDL
ncbi:MULTISPECIES: hypothetical protein [Ancylobacter]|uniref:Uncharacterized protein n=2 Tax=Ancylobacter TaxID=99 RepID=A0A839ZF74_9HYPH|nr:MULTISPECIES: hypothetical protein [Ancylobacter]MBB3773570.1 hypothetical protein [Ancylobacter tetraedralis]MDQ0512889.1 hypothetical protein [Ancylobacter amanitiformis]